MISAFLLEFDVVQTFSFSHSDSSEEESYRSRATLKVFSIICGGQRTTYRRQFSPSLLGSRDYTWVLRPTWQMLLLTEPPLWPGLQPSFGLPQWLMMGLNVFFRFATTVLSLVKCLFFYLFCPRTNLICILQFLYNGIETNSFLNICFTSISSNAYVSSLHLKTKTFIVFFFPSF